MVVERGLRHVFIFSDYFMVMYLSFESIKMFYSESLGFFNWMFSKAKYRIEWNVFCLRCGGTLGGDHKVRESSLF